MSNLFDLVSTLDTKANVSLILATIWIINNEYAQYTRSPLHIGHYASTKENRWQHEDIINAILIRTCKYDGEAGEPNIMFLLESENIYSNVQDWFGETFVDKAIWLIDSMEAFNALEEDLLEERNLYQRNGYFCILYTGNEGNRFDDMKTIFHKLFQIYALNVNVLLTIGNSLYVYTYFPFKRNHCHSSYPELHLSFRALNRTDFKLRKLFFPNKVANMWGCSLKVTTWTDDPFMIIEKDQRTNKIVSMQGIEGLLLSIIAEKMNFSMILAEPTIKTRGYFSASGASSGATKMLVDGETNLTVSSYMYDKLRSEYTLPAYPYMSAALVLAIPKGRKMTPFERLLRPFKYIIWSCLGSSVLFGIMVIFSLRLFCSRKVQNFVFGRYNRLPFTNFFSILWGGPILGHLPHRNFARYILVIWLLYSWIMRNSYTSELFVILQDDRANDVLENVEQALDDNYTFYTNPVLLKILGFTINPRQIANIDDKEKSIDKLLARLSSEEVRFVVTIYEQRLKSYNRHAKNQNDRVNMASQPLIVSLITLYLRPHSYLFHQINKLLLSLMSSGFVQKSEEMFLNSGRTAKWTREEPTELSLWLLLGVFSVYFVLLLLSIFVFLLELWAPRSPILRCLLKFFNI